MAPSTTTRVRDTRLFARLLLAAPRCGDIVLLNGEAGLARALLRSPGPRVRALCEAPGQAQYARDALARFGERFEASEFELSSRSWREFAGPVAGVCCPAGLDALDGDQTRRLLADLSRALMPGGVLVLAGHASPDWAPAGPGPTLLDRLRWLEAAGFARTAVFSLCGGGAVYGGRKPAHVSQLGDL